VPSPQSAAERKLGARVGGLARRGKDITEAQAQLDELTAIRHLRDAASRLVAVRAAQGFSAKVTDVRALAAIAGILAGGSGDAT
jgi:hypothetical protein